MYRNGEVDDPIRPEQQSLMAGYAETALILANIRLPGQ
jgi:hypothetical protein